MTWRTPAYDAQARKLHAEGWKDSAIAAALGMSPRTITGWRQRNKLPPIFPPRYPDEAALRRLYDEGLNDAEIARRTGDPRSTVWNWRKRQGLAPNAKRGGPRKPRWNDPVRLERQPMSQAIDLESLLAAATDSMKEKMLAEKKKRPKNMDMQARVLLDHLKAFDKPCPFKVGDLVQPTEHNPTWFLSMGLGIVTEILATPERAHIGDMSNVVYRYDMLILVAKPDGAVVEYRVDSRDFEPYAGQVAP